MRSFISNSKENPYQRRGYWTAMVLFLGTFMFLAAAGAFLAGALGPEHAWRGQAPSMAMKDLVVDEIDSDHFDIYDMLYYGIGDAIRNAKKADVLLLGNSRVLFAFREDSIQAFTGHTGLKVFNLCFPANDGMVMATEAMMRNNLRPAIVVVNESDFFNLGRSPYGTDTVQEGYARAWMRVGEHRVSWNTRLWLHRLFPRLGFGDLYRVEPNVAYQSIQDGGLVFENFSTGRESFAIGREETPDDPSAEELQIALRFKEFLAQRGASLVLTDIPYDMESYVRARKLSMALGALLLAPENLKPFHKAVKLAGELQVPLVAPPMEGLRTLDGSHLEGESAKKFAAGFFDRFAKLKVVRALRRSRPE